MKKLKKLMILLIACIMVLEPFSGFSLAASEHAEVIWVDSVKKPYPFDNGIASVDVLGAYPFNRAYVDSYGNMVVSNDFSHSTGFNEGVAVIEESDGFTSTVKIINRKGEGIQLVKNESLVLTDLKGPDVLSFYNRQTAKYIVTDRYGRKISPYEFDYEPKLNERGYLVANINDGVNGVVDLAINLKGEILASITAKEGVKYFSPHTNNVIGLIEARDEDWNFGYYTYSGKLVIPYAMDIDTELSEGAYAVNILNKSGHIDANGNAITPLIYDSATSFINGYAVVTKGGKSALVNKYGKVVTNFINSKIYPEVSEGMALTEQTDKNGYSIYGFIGLDGKVISCQFEFADPFKGGLASVRKNGKWGYINKSGSVVIPLKYDEAHDFNGSYAKVCVDGKYGFIDKKGNLVLPLEYSYIYHYESTYNSPFYYIAEKDNKSEIYEKNLNLIIPGNYELYSTNMYEKDPQKMFVMRDSNNKLAMFSSYGKQLTGFTYDFIFGESAFGLITFEQNELWGLIDSNGIEIIPAKYDGISINDRRQNNIDWIKVKQDGKYGMIDVEDNVVLPIEFDEIQTFSEGIAWVRKDNRWGFIKEPKRFTTMSTWASDSIEEARKEDLVPYECDGFYTNTITRLQFANLVTNLAEKVTGKRITPASIGQFNDTRADAALRAYGAGIITGSGNDYTFAPDAPVTREQAATMLYRTIKYIEQNTGKNIISSSKNLDSYVDQGQVSSWAREAISALAGSGIMEGSSKTTLSPSNKTSIEEAIILALRIYKII